MVSVTARHTLGHFDREGPDIAFTDIAYRLGGALVNYNLTLLTNQEQHHFLLYSIRLFLLLGGREEKKKTLKIRYKLPFFCAWGGCVAVAPLNPLTASQPRPNSPPRCCPSP